MMVAVVVLWGTAWGAHLGALSCHHKLGVWAHGSQSSIPQFKYDKDIMGFLVGL